MKIYRHLFIPLISLLLPCATVWSQSKVYVSVIGHDSSRGTASEPLRTIHQAIKLAAGQPGEIEIEVGEGKYAVDRTIEIAQGKWSSLTITSKDGKKVSVSGDVAIPIDAVKKISDANLLNRLLPRMRDSVRVIDFRELGIDIANLHETGFARPSLPVWNELFIDGEPLKLSRWPNDSMALIGKVLVAGNKEDKAAGRFPVFHYSGSRPDKWTAARNLWIGGYFGWGYADDLIPVKALDVANKTIQPATYSAYEFMTGTDFRRWYAVNLVEEIDRPGEYAIDAEEGKIYFYPPVGSFSEVRLSILTQPLFSVLGCANVTLKNLVIENARGIGVYMERTENAVVDSCTLRNIGNVAVCIGRGVDSVPGLVGDFANRLYEDVTIYRHAGKNNGVKNSYIYNTGAGGVSLGGGNRLTLEPANNFVENCIIRRYNRIEKSYRPAVWMDGVGCRITRCDISDAPSMAVLFHGNNHIIEYCRITNVCSEVDDQGAIYYGRDPSEQGHIIRYNYFKDLSPRHRVTATYHDDGACGSEVYGNIYFRAGSLPVLIGGGSDHHYFNNVFIESPVAIHLDNRLQNWAAQMCAPNGIFEKRLNSVNYQQPPYSKAYPRLVNYFSDNPELPKRNRIHGNLFYRIKKVVNGETQWGIFSNNWVTKSDPGFVDPEDPLKGFREDAPVFKRIKGFQDIPFDKIGCTLK